MGSPEKGIIKQYLSEYITGNKVFTSDPVAMRILESVSNPDLASKFDGRRL